MAAVSIVNSPTRHVIGDLVLRVFEITGASTNTLDTGMNNILAVLISPGSAITAATWSGGTVTFTTAGGAITTEVVVVIARTG
jgi:hypothetical protein